MTEDDVYQTVKQRQAILTHILPVFFLTPFPLLPFGMVLFGIAIYMGPLIPIVFYYFVGDQGKGEKTNVGCEWPSPPPQG